MHGTGVKITLSIDSSLSVTKFHTHTKQQANAVIP